jgi:hypothetical protein
MEAIIVTQFQSMVSEKWWFITYTIQVWITNAKKFGHPSESPFCGQKETEIHLFVSCTRFSQLWACLDACLLTPFYYPHISSLTVTIRCNIHFGCLITAFVCWNIRITCWKALTDLKSADSLSTVQIEPYSKLVRSDGRNAVKKCRLSDW